MHLAQLFPFRLSKYQSLQMSAKLGSKADWWVWGLDRSICQMWAFDVPCLRLDHMSEAQKRADVFEHNNLLPFADDVVQAEEEFGCKMCNQDPLAASQRDSSCIAVESATSYGFLTLRPGIPIGQVSLSI